MLRRDGAHWKDGTAIAAVGIKIHDGEPCLATLRGLSCRQTGYESVTGARSSGTGKGSGVRVKNAGKLFSIRLFRIKIIRAGGTG